MSTPVSDATSIRFYLPGIAELIETRELKVPIYQRSYAWNVSSEGQVQEFWNDLQRAFSLQGEYFLGTVVLSREGDDSRRTIIDGQQRLATTSLLLAAIRDMLVRCGNSKAEVIERDYLAKETLTSAGKDRRLWLNIDDDDYFGKIASGEVVADPDPKVPSQGRIKSAFDFLLGKIEKATSSGGDPGGALLGWAAFLRDRARIGVIEVPTESDAYIIFETLNDRGQDLTPADLLKNYLYGRAGMKLTTVQQAWARTLGSLELTAADGNFMTYLRHYWSSRKGVTREKDLYGAIKRSLTQMGEVVEFAGSLADEAVMYAAISNPSHEYWQNYGTGSRTDIEILSKLNLKPNRPLILAALGRLSHGEMRKLLRALVSWSVRATILGTINSGQIEEAYCSAAIKIRSGVFTTCNQIRASLLDVIATDTEFQDEFTIASVRKSASARYYLQALERQSASTPEPELVPNDDENQVNLEHVLPKNASPNQWAGINSGDDVDLWAHRLGNMVLLAKGANSRIGNKPFVDKKAILAGSSLLLTKDVGLSAEWNPDAIQKRQASLAALAVQAWPR